MPWLAGFGGIIGVLGGISLMLNGLGITNTYWWGVLAGFSPTYMVVSGFLEIIGGIILLLAFNPLKARQRTGWILLFWSMVVGLAGSAVTMVFMPTDLVSEVLGLAIGLVIGFYLYFQIESSYSKK